MLRHLFSKPLQPKDFFIPFAISAGCSALFIGASVVYRLSKGKPLLRPKFEKPLFLETWRSGRSLRNVFTRLCSANNCLWIAVNESTLLIGAHCPFNLTFLPEVCGLELAVPGRAIRSVERADGLVNRTRLRVTFERQLGAEGSVEVCVRDADAFMRAIEAIRQAK